MRPPAKRAMPSMLNMNITDLLTTLRFDLVLTPTYTHKKNPPPSVAAQNSIIVHAPNIIAHLLIIFSSLKINLN